MKKKPERRPSKVVTKFGQMAKSMELSRDLLTAQPFRNNMMAKLKL